MENLNKTIADGMISIVIPETFNELTEAELKAAEGKGPDHAWAIQNKELHSIYSIGWDAIPLLGRGVELEKVMRNTEKTISKKVPNYSKNHDVKRLIGNQEALGIEYSYVVGDIHMKGEYLLVKYNKKYISFLCIARVGCFDENYHTYEEMLKSVAFH